MSHPPPGGVPVPVYRTLEEAHERHALRMQVWRAARFLTADEIRALVADELENCPAPRERPGL